MFTYTLFTFVRFISSLKVQYVCLDQKVWNSRSEHFSSIFRGEKSQEPNGGSRCRVGIRQKAKPNSVFSWSLCWKNIPLVVRKRKSTSLQIHLQSGGQKKLKCTKYIHGKMLVNIYCLKQTMTLKYHFLECVLLLAGLLHVVGAHNSVKAVSSYLLFNKCNKQVYLHEPKTWNRSLELKFSHLQFWF